MGREPTFNPRHCRRAAEVAAAVKADTLPSGENAMIVVVEIAGRRGDRAAKEYEAPSLEAAMRAAERELQAHPRFRIIDVWIKDKSSERSWERERFGSG
jgi:hypothetical protein